MTLLYSLFKGYEGKKLESKLYSFENLNVISFIRSHNVCLKHECGKYLSLFLVETEIMKIIINYTTILDKTRAVLSWDFFLFVPGDY